MDNTETPTHSADYGSLLTAGPTDNMVAIDRTASTVTIAGRRFPAVALICPPDPPEYVIDVSDNSEQSRALGAGAAPADRSVYVPAENGLLFFVEEAWNERYHGLSFGLNARTCQLTGSRDDRTWLPWSVAVVDGRFVVGRSNCWCWAEPEWVVEAIDRLSRKPFVQPDGPSVQIVRLSHFDGGGAS